MVMTRVEVKSRVGADGVLNVSVPLGPQEANREVIVTVQPAINGTDPSAWNSFVEQTAGSIDDPTFTRHDQGKYEQREQLP
jgi:hypothetical protein